MSLTVSASQDSLPGLTSAQAENLYIEGQSNALPFQDRRSLQQFLRDTVVNVFNFDLLGIGIALWLLGRPQDALISVAVLLGNISLSTLLGYRNWRQVARLLDLTENKATVFRDDQIVVIDPDELVPGDAVVIGPGDQFYVDGTIIGGSPIRLDDYAVNGSETFVTAEVGDPVYGGSYCVTGHGVYTVTAVGEDRRLAGKLTDHNRAGHRDTPLQQLIKRILRILRVMVIVLIAILLWRFFFSVDKSDELYDLYVTAISIIFSIAPSGLLFMILVTYASGAAKIGPLGAVVRQPAYIEALAQTEVLCLGKTGTLTGGEARLEQMAPEEAESTISDTRLSQLVGSFARSAATMTPLLQVLANSFEGARFEPTREAPYLALLGWQALCFDAPELGGTYVLGIERFVTPLLDSVYPVAPPEDGRDNALLFAYTPAQLELFTGPGQVAPPSDLLPLARIYLTEFVREEAVATTEAFRNAGITVKILSSATVDSVVATARESGLVSASAGDVPTLSGRELDQLEEDERFPVIERTDLFGRHAPHQKEVVVETLRDHGVRVAMVAETVMEVPAVRAADVGIAMAGSNQAALNEADILLLDNNLSALPAILELGQGVFNRLLDTIKLSLSHALVACWLALMVLFTGPYYFPYAQANSLTIVLFTITLPSIMLSWWLIPGKIAADNLARRLLVFAIPASLTVALLVMAVFLYFDQSASTSYARTAVAHTLVLSGLILIIFVQPPNEFWAAGDSVSGDYRPTQMVVVLYLVFLVLAQQTTWRTRAFEIGPLRSLSDLLVVWGLTAVWALILRQTWRLNTLRRLARFSLRRPEDESEIV